MIVIKTLYAQLEEKEQQFFCNRTCALEKHWNKCISVTGDCVEKWQNMTNNQASVCYGWLCDCFEWHSYVYLITLYKGDSFNPPRMHPNQLIPIALNNG